jgi:hypothetical protein
MTQSVGKIVASAAGVLLLGFGGWVANSIIEMQSKLDILVHRVEDIEQHTDVVNITHLEEDVADLREAVDVVYHVGCPICDHSNHSEIFHDPIFGPILRHAHRHENERGVIILNH